MTEDIIDALAGIAPDSPLDTLRRQRIVTRKTAQSIYEHVIFATNGSLTAAERAAAALVSARAGGNPALIAHYEALLAAAPQGMGRLEVVDFAVRLSLLPRAASQEALEKLASAGLSELDIVLLTQIIGLVSFQTRLLAGLALLKERSK